MTDMSTQTSQPFHFMFDAFENISSHRQALHAQNNHYSNKRAGRGQAPFNIFTDTPYSNKQYPKHQEQQNQNSNRKFHNTTQAKPTRVKHEIQSRAAKIQASIPRLVLGVWRRTANDQTQSCRNELPMKCCHFVELLILYVHACCRGSCISADYDLACDYYCTASLSASIRIQAAFRIGGSTW